MKIFVGGCSGVGKTTLLQTLKQEGFSVVHATSSFMSWLGIENDYEILRSFEQQKRERLLNQFMEELVSTTDSFVIDSHYSIMVNGKIMDSMNDWVEHVDAFVLVTAPEEVLLGRIQKDFGRDRALFPESASKQEKLSYLADFQKHLRKQSRKLSEESRSPYLELSNVHDVEISSSKLLNFVKSQKF